MPSPIPDALSGPLPIAPWQLGMALGFMLLAQGVSSILKLGLTKDMAVGSVRCIAQLLLMGYALTFLFNLDSMWVMVAVFVGMIIVAAHTVRGRVQEKRIPVFQPIVWSMLLSYLGVTMVVTGLVVRADPWWTPQYFIPLGGMVIGNSMSTVAIAVDRFLSDMKTKRDLVEMRLLHGADAREATQDIMRDAVKAGMIPPINSLMAVGLVSLPGMMSGQILSGVDPLLAVRYQMIIMLMLVASAAITTMVSILWVQRRVFGPGLAPVLDHH